MNEIQKNLETVQKKISKTCKAWDVNENSIELIAVSKKQPDEKIEAMLETGHRVYGENRVQDAVARWVEKKPQYKDVQLHLIGALQTNKVSEAVALFDAIHSVDRSKLVRALVKEMKAQGKALGCFIQVNTGEEDQKAGVLPEDFEALYQICQDEGLEIRGLMCIPPFDEPPAHHFALLRKMAEAHGLKELSIGMSGDFEKAIPFAMEGGKVFIRVGTSLFGAREY
jgi:pyridoxal phosphate enzyme (YggS family)